VRTLQFAGHITDVRFPVRTLAACRVLASYCGHWDASHERDVAPLVFAQPRRGEQRGQAVEKAIAGLWLSPAQATLLTAALTQAWKTVLNQNRPWWQRLDVLIGTLAGIVFLGLIIAASRDSR